MSPVCRLRAVVRALSCFVVAASLGCSSSTPPKPAGPSVLDFLPELPPTGGNAIAEAGVVTQQNRAQYAPAGDAAKGLPGDYYLRNDKIRVLIQAPGRFGETLGYGGNPINLAFMPGDGRSHHTQFGEISAFLNASHTVNFTKVEIVRDGKAGGPAVIRATGVAAILDYFNISGFVAGLGILKYDPNVPPPLDVAATYLLSPGDPWVRVIYTLFNRGDAAQPVTIGTFLDTGGEVAPFTPGNGFGGGGFSDLASIIGNSRAVDYYVGQSPGSAFGVVPAKAGSLDPLANSVVFVAGQAVALHDTPSLLDALGTTNFNLAAKEGRSYESYLVMGRDAGEVHAQVLRLRKRTTGTLAGRVVVGTSTTPAPLARVALLDAAQRPLSVYTSQEDGSFGGVLEPGTYTLIADKIGWPRSAEQRVTIAAGATATAALSLPETAKVPYRVTDGADRNIAAKITIVGTDPSPPDARFHSISDGFAAGVVRTYYTRRGTSDDESVLEIEPGTYRVVVSRGSEYTLDDRMMTFAAGGNDRLVSKLVRVLDSPGYVKADFHQHGVNSPDAATPMRERLVTYLAAGMEFIGSSDHDYLTDYTPLIAELGVADQIASMVGVESTPFDYGHFNAFPLPVRADMPNNGAPDWGDGEHTNLSPGRLFAKFRSLGASVVQVNHARVPGARSSPYSGFQAYFDRVALSYDLDLGVFGGDEDAQPVANDVLRIAADEPLWSDDFDTMEIYNGFSLKMDPQEGQVVDEKVDVLRRDWFNLLSMGKVVTAVGNTDSHGRNNDPAEAPFNYVRVTDDTRPGFVTKEDVLNALKVSRDVIVTNGPFVTFHVNGDAQPALGRLVAATNDRVRLTIKVQSPAWMPVDEVKVYSNNRYQIPPPPTGFEAMAPRLVVRLSENPGANEARLTRTVVAVGAERFDATIEVPEFQLPDAGKDAWIVVEVRGSRGLYPYLGSGVSASTPIAELQSSTFAGGVFPLAFTNPAFIDRNGNGRYDAPLKR
jgi:hypothetical protein